MRDLISVPELGRSPGGGHGNPLQYSCLENPYGQRSLVGYSPCGGKESITFIVGDLGWEDPLEEGMATHSSILAWKSHGQRSLVGCCPCSCKELDTTEAT